MAYTHDFEIEISESGKLEGEIDFDNPNDGIKFTSIEEGTELHIRAMQAIVGILNNVKLFAITAGGLTKLEIKKKE